MEIAPVLHDAYTENIKLIEVYVSSIKDKKCASEVLKILSQVLPMTEMRHLKRIRTTKSRDGSDCLQIVLERRDIIEKLCSDVSLKNLEQTLHTDLTALDGIHVMKVPHCAPLTRVQYEEVRLEWPVEFHETKLIKKLMSGDYFTSEELTSIRSHMSHALYLAETANEVNQRQTAAVIVDPLSNERLAESCDQRHSDNSLRHAVMEAVASVAERQRCHYDLAKLSTTQSDNKSKQGPYLCTGYDLYVTHEPCTMCAMALVHSRIRCVFYIHTQQDGALGSRYKLHVLPALNHRYQVFCLTMSRKTESDQS